MLKADNIQFAYGKTPVIRGLNLEISTATIHGLVGMNGSGKTTFLKMLAGHLTADEGEFTWKGKPLRPGTIAYMETSPAFFSRTRGREYLELFQLSNPGFDIDGWNELFALPLEALTESYSTGMRRKLAFMGMIGLGRDIMLLDEPFNGLDMDGVEKMKQVIQVLAEKGKTILITSHILESLTSIAGKISLLEAGKTDQTFPWESFGEMEQSIRQKVQHEVRSHIDRLNG